MNKKNTFEGEITVKKTLFVGALAAALVFAFASSALAASGIPNRSSAYLSTIPTTATNYEAQRDIAGGGSKAAYVTWPNAQADMVKAGEVETLTPHGNYTTTTIKCQVCHSVHKAVNSGSKLLMNADGGCVVCHGATSSVGSNIKVSADGSAADNGGYSNEDQRHGKATSCVDYECHASSPHGIGVSSYAAAKSAMLSNAVDPLITAALASGVSNVAETAVIDDDWTASMGIDEVRIDVKQPALEGADALAVTAPADATAKARGRAIVTGYTCANNGCHINGSFNGLSSDAEFGAYRIVLGGVEQVNSSTETTYGIDALRDESIKGHSLFTATASSAFSTSGECKACHDNTDARRGNAKSFPHSNAVWRAAVAADPDSIEAYGWTRLYSDAAWFKVAGGTGDTFVSTTGRTVPATAPTFGQALTVGMDGACLKCHREGSVGAYTSGVGVTY